MDKWTPEKRVITTLNHEEPDRIPIHEGSIEIPELAQSTNALNEKPGLLFMPYGITRILTTSWVQPVRKTFFKILKKPSVLDPIIKPAFNQTTGLFRKYRVDLIGYTAGIPMIFSEKLYTDFYVDNLKRRVMGPHNNIVTELPSNNKGGAVQRNGFLNGPEDYEKYMEFDSDHPGNYFFIINFHAIL
ncbi:MAG: hypothetical protein JW776_08660 [Candidatus Lokiarchaeota archaeon]|nr:hypothetical protein [Candidatus Lokiarchaeota archaeon]